MDRADSDLVLRRGLVTIAFSISFSLCVGVRYVYSVHSCFQFVYFMETYLSRRREQRAARGTAGCAV